MGRERGPRPRRSHRRLRLPENRAGGDRRPRGPRRVTGQGTRGYGTFLHRPPGLCLGHLDPDHGRGRAGDPALAGRAVSPDRAALGHGRGQLSRCLGRDGGQHRHAGDRAADDRARWPALFLVALDLAGQYRDHAHLRDRHRRRYRAGAGAEQARAGHAAAARNRAAAGHHGREILGRVPDGRGHDLDRRHARQVDLSDYMSTNLVDELSRVEGVGSVQVFGSEYAMRIWLDPSKLAAFGMSPSEVVAAVSAQNAQISAGAFGARPAVDGQQLNATITAQSLLNTPEDFRQIVLRAETDGGLVLLDDVARVEIGAQNYATTARFNTDPAAGMAITLAPGANALDTARAIKERMAEFARFFPEGVDYVIPYDTTPFVEISIKEVVKTLFEAIGLVFL